MRQINEELIEKDSLNEQASGIEISDLVTDEQEGEIVDEQSETENQQRTSRAQQSEQILSAFAEQTSSSLSETFDHEDHLQGTNSLPTAKRSFQGIEEDEDEELSEHTTEQYHGRDGNDHASMGFLWLPKGGVRHRRLAQPLQDLKHSLQRHLGLLNDPAPSARAK